jgi:membrane-associated protease RseP (regulator of RpoE activity)
VVNLDAISIIIFYTLLFLFFLTHRSKFTMQGKIFALYKTKLGLTWMNKISQFFPRAQKIFWNIGVLVGFTGMAFILFFLIKETIKLILVPGTPPALAPVLPGISIPGAPALSFWHWVITIFVAAVVHEFSHGIVARLYNIPVKSSGFAFLGPILAAFVEPEENVVEKKKPLAQMSMFAAGPFSNMILAVIFVGILALITPAIGSMYQGEGIAVAGLTSGFPMEDTGIEAPFIITQINGEDTLDIEQFVAIMAPLEVGDTITLSTDKGEYEVTTIENPSDKTKAYVGIEGLSQQNVLKEEHQGKEKLANIYQWFLLLTMWLFIVNLGIGLFNLLPLGPVDGGRMFYSLALVVFKSKDRANKALGFMTILCLGLIIINMIPWFTKLIVWIWSGISLLVLLI